MPRPGSLTRHLIKITSVVIIGNITLLVNSFLHFKLLILLPLFFYIFISIYMYNLFQFHLYICCWSLPLFFILYILFYIYCPHLRIYLYICIFPLSSLFFGPKSKKARNLSTPLFFYSFQYVRLSSSLYSFINLCLPISFSCISASWHLALST